MKIRPYQTYFRRANLRDLQATGKKLAQAPAEIPNRGESNRENASCCRHCEPRRFYASYVRT